MKKTIPYVILASALSTFGWLTAQGNMLQDWQFSEPTGTGLVGVTNSGSDFAVWDDNIGDSSTTGNGVYRIQRAVGNTHTAYASIWNVPPVTWLVVELEGWALSENEGGFNEDMRFGYSYTTTGNQYAEIWMGRRASSNEMFIQGVAELRSGGGEWIPPIPTGLTNEESRPVRLVLKLDRSSGDPAEHSYSVYYNIDGAGHVLVGRGGIDSGRNPNYIRFRAINSFADRMDPENPESPMEFVDVSRIYMTATDPIGGDVIDAPTIPLPEEKIVHDWHFDEAAGTTLSGTENSTGEIDWTSYSGDPADDIGNSFTTGDGAFRIQRIPGGGQTNLAYIERQWTGKQWMVVDFRGWNLVGDAEEWMQFGFIDDYTTGPDTLAEIRLRRWTAGVSGAPATPDSTKVYVAGRAFGSTNGAEVIDDAGLLSAEQVEPVRFVLEYDADAKTYAIYYRVADGDYELVGAGNTDTSRGPNALRFFVSNSFSEEGEFADVERIFLTTRNPMLPVENGYEGGAAGHFPEGGLDAEEDADPDGDGISNLLEYAFGLVPEQAGRDGAPVVSSVDGYVEVMFQRNRAAADLTFRVMASTDLSNWTEIASATGTGDFVASGASDIDVVANGEIDSVTVTDSEAITGNSRRFLRVEVTVSAP